MIRITNYRNEFVKVSLTGHERIDVLTLKNIIRDAKRICRGKNMRIEVEITENLSLPNNAIALFKKVYSSKFKNNFVFNWYGKSYTENDAEDKKEVSQEILNYLTPYYS